MIHYVYGLYESATAEIPFYVGKGSEGTNREFDHEKEASRGIVNLKCNKIRKILRTGGRIYPRRIHEGLSEVCAYSYEALLTRIWGLRHEGGVLTNDRHGGMGGTWNPSPETRAKFGAATKGKPLTVSHRASIGAGLRGKQKSVSHRAAMSVVRKGKPLSVSHRAVIKAFHACPEYKAAIGNANRGKKRTKEQCAAQSAARMGKKQSPAHYAAMKAGHNRPEVLAANAAKSKKYWDDHHTARAKHSAAVRAAWTRPEVRSSMKMAAALRAIQKASDERKVREANIARYKEAARAESLDVQSD